MGFGGFSRSAETERLQFRAFPTNDLVTILYNPTEDEFLSELKKFEATLLCAPKIALFHFFPTATNMPASHLKLVLGTGLIIFAVLLWAAATWREGRLLWL
jgi:hypothetical protein